MIPASSRAYAWGHGRERTLQAKRGTRGAVPTLPDFLVRLRGEGASLSGAPANVLLQLEGSLLDHLAGPNDQATAQIHDRLVEAT